MSKFFVLATLLTLSVFDASVALENITCAASHECHSRPSILMVSPVFSSSLSLLDEAIVGGAFPRSESPIMRTADFPIFSHANEQIILSPVLSSKSFEGFLSVDSHNELGMF